MLKNRLWKRNRPIAITIMPAVTTTRFLEGCYILVISRLVINVPVFYRSPGIFI